MPDFLRFLLPSSPRAPRLDWVQVELSTACNASCAYCPRTALADSWQSRFMKPDLFKRLVPQLARTGFIHLQGWGESLLHPHFFEILELAKSTGRPVSMTTNGTLITPEVAERLVLSGVDTLALSVAGASERSNGRWRKGTSLTAVKDAARYLRDAARKLDVRAPRLHLACMVLAEHVEPKRMQDAQGGERPNAVTVADAVDAASAMNELDGLTDLALEIGASQVVLNSLSLVLAPCEHTLPNESGPAETAMTEPELNLVRNADLAPGRAAFQRLRERVIRSRERAYAMGVNTRGNLDTPFTQKPRCTENVDRAVVIAADGRVAPCVMCTLPIKTREDGNGVSWPNVLGFSGPAPLPHMIFGDLNEQTLADILRSPERRGFLKNFSRGRVPSCCAACRKRFSDRFLTPDEIDLSQAHNRYDLVARDIASRKERAGT